MSAGLTTHIQVPRTVWCKSREGVVEVLKTGHFPDTVIVRTPDDLEIEVPFNDLEIYESHKR